MLSKVNRPIVRQQLGGSFYVTYGDFVAFLDQAGQLLDEARHARRVRRLSFHQEVISLRSNANVEQGLEVAEVVVVGADEGFQGRLRNGNLTLRRGWNSRISLCYSNLQESIDDTKVSPGRQVSTDDTNYSQGRAIRPGA